jgi:phosphoglycolate phosphatase
MNNFKLTIFDFDGTLVSSIDGITVCMQSALQQFGYRAPSRDDLRATVGKTLEDSIRILTEFRCPESDMPTIVHAYRELYAEVSSQYTSLLDGAERVLTTFKGLGVKNVLVSNKGSVGLYPLLDKLGITEHFDLILAADHVCHTKPSSALYDVHIAGAFPEISTDKIIVVGDTTTDIRFAQNIGAVSCWASYGYGDVAECAGLQPSYTIGCVGDLLRIARVPTREQLLRE